MEKMKMRKAWQLNYRAFRMLYTLKPMFFISKMIALVFEVIPPYVEIYLAAQILNELAGERNAETLWRLVAVTVVVTAVLEGVKHVLKKWQNTESAAWYMYESVIQNEKLLNMDYVKVDEPHTYELLSTIRQNANWSNWGFGKILTTYFEKLTQSALQVAGSIVLLWGLFTSKVPAASAYQYLNNPLFIVGILLIMMIITILSPYCSYKANTYWAKSSDTARFGNRIMSHFCEMVIDNHRTMDIRIYRQDRYIEQLEDDSFTPKSLIAKYFRGPAGILSGLSTALARVFTGIAYVYVGVKAWAGAFGIGSVSQYIGAITALSNGVSGLINLAGELRNNAEFLETTFEFLDIPNTMYQGSLTTEKRADRHYEVEFRDVSFKYPSSDEYALRHVSMKFNVGERLAVVGMNGSGKTTFIKLLCRLYDPTEGQILLNGIDIRKYKYDDYMAIFSVVFQDFKLLAQPLGENVAINREYNAAKVQDCLEKAGYAERLASMPEGLKTYLYKDYAKSGVEISGGEAQKIAIARALYKDAPFIILDEPTAALDPIAEYEIYTRFNEIVGDKTAIYISHRLSSCRFCDTIAVFDQGQVIQKGSHDTLVAEETGKYYELWNAQAQYYT